MESALLARLATEIHTFVPLDLLTVGTLAILEGVLSVDNALVLAILIRALPPRQQRKALTYGLVGAFVFRFIALLFAALLMRWTIFKLIGGGYLLYIAMKHMFFFSKEEAYRPQPKRAVNFWMVVGMVELTDVAFSIDSITTAVAMSDKLLIVWLGGIMGIVFLRFLSSFFVRLLEKLPKLEDLAYQLVFFVGIKLTLEGFHLEIGDTIFWVMMGVIVTIGASLTYRDYHQKTSQTQFHSQLLERLKKNDLPFEEFLALDAVPREVIQYLHDTGQLEIRTPTGKDPAGPA